MVVEEEKRKFLEKTKGFLAADGPVELNTSVIPDDIRGSQNTFAPAPHSMSLDNSVGSHSKLCLLPLPPDQEWRQQQQQQQHFSQKLGREEAGETEHPHTPQFPSFVFQQPQNHRQRYWQQQPQQRPQQLHQCISLSSFPSSSASRCVSMPVSTSLLGHRRHEAIPQEGMQLQLLQQAEGAKAGSVFQAQQCMQFFPSQHQQEA